jgi:hypothetical protein
MGLQIVDNGTSKTFTNTRTGESWTATNADIAQRKADADAKTAENDPEFIPYDVFLDRVTPFYGAILGFAQAAAAQGNFQPMLWMERSRVEGGVYPNSERAITAKAAFVSAELMSQADADALFAAP